MLFSFAAGSKILSGALQLTAVRCCPPYINVPPFTSFRLSVILKKLLEFLKNLPVNLITALDHTSSGVFNLLFSFNFFLTSRGCYLTISVFFLLTTHFAKNFCDFLIYLRLFGFLSIKLSIFSRRNFIIFIFCLRRIAWLKPNLDHKKRRNTARWKYQFYVNTRLWQEQLDKLKSRLL